MTKETVLQQTFQTKILKKIDSRSTIASKKYSKITPEIKCKLAYLIVQQNFTIKDVTFYFIQAAKKLNINYSSAKGIFATHRLEVLKTENNTATIRSQYRQLEKKCFQFKIVYTVGGVFEGELN